VRAAVASALARCAPVGEFEADEATVSRDSTEDARGDPFARFAALMAGSDCPAISTAGSEFTEAEGAELAAFLRTATFAAASSVPRFPA
jgi:hypothetical protein